MGFRCGGVQERVGKEGVITVQDGKTLHNELEVPKASPRMCIKAFLCLCFLE